MGELKLGFIIIYTLSYKTIYVNILGHFMN
nr:MAG TPA: hypothetical protein [Caudoviricetes sp.]